MNTHTTPSIFSCVRIVALIAWLALLSAAHLAAAEKRIDIILWFDTEDYLLPADDDACTRLAEMLTARNIRATFKIVGEKARVLEQRGRRDVIDALKKHDIGYHSNFHSVHPTPAEFLAECGLLDGIAEFARREGGGAADVRRIFGVEKLACYGQPGSSWGSQAIAALPEMGIAPCYVDEGSHVGLNNKPFYFAGALNVFKMGRGRCYTRMELHDPAVMEPAKKEITAMAERLAKEDGGGIVSIFYHPCEWVHQQFWDGVNFSRGANPPRKAWRPPLQRTPEETESAYQRFSAYLDHMRNIPGVRFVTASDLPNIYPDAVRSVEPTGRDIGVLARGILARDAAGLNYQIIDNKAYSLADQFELLTRGIAQLFYAVPVPKHPIAERGLLGPDSAPPVTPERLKATPDDFRESVMDTLAFIAAHKRVPSRIFIGAEAVAPADFLVAMADVLEMKAQTGQLGPVSFPVNTAVAPASHIAEDTPKLFGDWVIHKVGFRAPKILEIARLQAWTLKPALRKE